MNSTDTDQLKREVRDFWNRESCGVKHTKAEKYTRAYYDEIEAHRYIVEPDILAFAQFPLFHGQKVLEVGTGAGTDFIQWIRCGAEAYGVDLTEEGVEHVKRRCELYGLQPAEIRVADAEDLPYEDNTFDLVYSWGVIHHSPDTEQALAELIRVTRPGGRIKVMIYNRHSLVVLYKYIYYALLRGKPFKSLNWVLYHHQESPGTKAYTFAEVRRLLEGHPVELNHMAARATNYDMLWGKSIPLVVAASCIAGLLGINRCGFFLTFDLTKTV